MKETIFTIVIIITLLINVEMVMAYTDAEAARDSKPAGLSLVDRLYLRAEAINLSSVTKANALINRINGKVEYVWSYRFKCYVRPKYVLPDAQKIYDQTHS
jgi:hypothetical protein